MNEKAKQLIVRKFVEHWQKENKELVADIEKLSGDVVFFNMMWGTDFYLAHRPLKEEDVLPAPQSN